MTRKQLIKKIDKSLQFNDDLQKYFDLIVQHLTQCGDNLVLLTLTGHLMIENLLEINLARLLDIESLPSDANDKLEFNQKLKLVQAVVIAREPNPNADLFCAIAKLNKIRNDLAHKLMTKDEIDVAIKSIIQSYQSKADKKLSLDKTTAMQLRACICELCKFLFDVRVHFHKLDQQEDE
jgi:hypothetical protein